MELSSEEVKYLLDGLKRINQKIEYLNISENKLDSSGIECLKELANYYRIGIR